MKIVLKKEQKETLATLAVLACFLVVCISFYNWYEGWHTGTSLTFVIVTMSTVGYGYQHPSDDNSRLFTVYVMICGVFGVYGAINKVVVTRLEAINREANKRNKDLTSAEIYTRQNKRLMLNVLMILASLFFAAGGFSLLEDWTFARGLYFAVQTATTVGFGDILLTHSLSNRLIGLYILVSTILLAFAFNNFKTLNEDFKKLKDAAEFSKRRQTLAKIKELDTGQGVPMEMFILAVLEQLGVLDRDADIEPWIKKFKEIDTDGSGFIDSEEIEAFSAQESTIAAEHLQSLNTAAEQSSLPFNIAKTFSLAFSFTDTVDETENGSVTSESSCDSYDIDARSEDAGEEDDKKHTHGGVGHTVVRYGYFEYFMLGFTDTSGVHENPVYHANSSDNNENGADQNQEQSESTNEHPHETHDHTHHQHHHRQHHQRFVGDLHPGELKSDDCKLPTFIRDERRRRSTIYKGADNV